jgi:hypothetical protein
MNYDEKKNEIDILFVEDFVDMAFGTLDGLFKNLKINIDNCPVCLGKLNDQTITTTCGHVFCKGCHHKSLLYSKYCPVCRNTIGNTIFKTEAVDSDVVTYDDDSDYDSGDDVEVIDSDTDDEDYAEIVPVIKKRKVRALCH